MTEVVDQRRPARGIDVRRSRYDDALVGVHPQYSGLDDKEVAASIYIDLHGDCLELERALGDSRRADQLGGCGGQPGSLELGRLVAEALLVRRNRVTSGQWCEALDGLPLVGGREVDDQVRPVAEVLAGPSLGTEAEDHGVSQRPGG